MRARALTLVELMVVLVILLMVVGAIYQTFSFQRATKARESSLIETQEKGQLVLNILARDLMMAGYGVWKKLALYIEDGNTTGPDKIYINDWTLFYTNDTQLLNGLWGQTKIVSGSGSNSIVVEELDINKDNETDFKPNVYQFIISDALDHKVARITEVNDSLKSLTLDRTIGGTYVAPAWYYEISYDHTKKTYTLRKSARDTGGRQPLADNIVDLQIAYRDTEGNWYCDGVGNCPMTPFDPEKINLIRLSIVVRSEKKTKISHNPWPLENRQEELPYDSAFSYRVYTVEIAPRNLIYNR